ncbi:M24 family metallopeptidase [Rhodoligotrophos defluvii]|uniref:M24 family metallopeptidase n=1 Tax=Rhodoligotrophos defluvii TaxID=2561934 RepID=UPI0010C95BD8|nr:Xaa-Pro peptidase family protein [Rhodoligotrophos defluvii]
MKLDGLHLHFSREEFAARQNAAVAAMEARGLSALLMFRQESMYYLTGYDTFGYVYFQCMVLTADGRLVLLTRSPDKLQAKFTSVLTDVRIWVDRVDANPVQDLKAILAELGLSGKRLGVEWGSYGLNALNGQRLQAGLDGFATLEDATDLVSRLRVRKSPAELAYVRKAAELADAALKAAEDATAPGAFEGDIIADMQAAIYRGGGDDPANEHIIGSGPGALMCRYFTGRRHLDANDMLTLELAGVYRHYHACLMRTVGIGTVDPRLVSMHGAALDALYAAEEALRPGRPIGEVFDAHARVLDRAGHAAHRMNACGYSLGTTYAPNWMDWPMFYHGNPYVAEPGNVFFIHIIVFDEANGLAMTHGRTSLVTEKGSETLSAAPVHFVRK